MADEDELADRVRAALSGTAVSEKRMFGGLAFLVEGHMVCASGQGGLLVRVDPSEAPRLLEQPGVETVQMGARGAMKGWVRVASPVLADDPALAAWVQRGLTRVRDLPPE